MKEKVAAAVAGIVGPVDVEEAKSAEELAVVRVAVRVLNVEVGVSLFVCEWGTGAKASCDATGADPQAEERHS